MDLPLTSAEVRNIMAQTMLGERYVAIWTTRALLGGRGYTPYLQFSAFAYPSAFTVGHWGEIRLEGPE
jgi:hypothetical protein